MVGACANSDATSVQVTSIRSYLGSAMKTLVDERLFRPIGLCYQRGTPAASAEDGHVAGFGRHLENPAP